MQEQPQIFETFVTDQRLREFRDTLHHVDEVEHNTSFRPHDEIEIAQADVEIDNDDFFTCCASAAPSAAVDVVFPTPPFPDVTTKTLAILISFVC